jgi:hypothetical protein
MLRFSFEPSSGNVRTYDFTKIIIPTAFPLFLGLINLTNRYCCACGGNGIRVQEILASNLDSDIW